jgi:hypothetical protein
MQTQTNPTAESNRRIREAERQVRRATHDGAKYATAFDVWVGVFGLDRNEAIQLSQLLEDVA